MNKTLTCILTGLLLTSCGFFGDKVDFFKGIDFKNHGNWLLVHSNPDYDTCGVIFDRELLLKLYKDLVIKSTSECGGTTPDYSIDLYKNGKRIQSVGYCSWEPLSYRLGRLQKEFKPAVIKMVKAESIARHDLLLDSLKRLDNIYLLYPQDTTIEFSDQLKFDIKLVDRDQEIFKQEKSIEEEFKRIFKNDRYQVEADWYSSKVGSPKELSYHIIVDCDSIFLEHFDSSKLKESDLFQEMNNYKYLKKKFQIIYYEWTE